MTRHEDHLHQRGFTLLEVLLYIGIFSVMSTVISIFLVLVLETRVKSQTIAEVEQQGLAIVALLTQTIRNAEAINEPTAAMDAGALSLDAAGTGDDPTWIEVSDGALWIKRGASESQALNNNHVIVSAVSFQNLSSSQTPGTIRFQFTLAAVNPSDTNPYNYVETFYASATLRQP